MAQRRVRRQSREAAPSAAADASSITGEQRGAGKRKRHVLRDISEEHSCKGVSTRQQQQQQQQQDSAATSSRRHQDAPHRPSPMAPARRSSARIRRSRRLNEQQPSAADITSVSGDGSGGGGRGLRSGQRRSRSAAATAIAVAETGAAAEGRSGTPQRRRIGTPVQGPCLVGFEEEKCEEEDGSMSCDEDLEGMVVDLSFEGVADEQEESNKRQPALQASTGPSGIESAGNRRGEGARKGGSSSSSSSSGGREAASGDQSTAAPTPDDANEEQQESRLQSRPHSRRPLSSACEQKKPRTEQQQHVSPRKKSTSTAEGKEPSLPPGVKDIDEGVQDEGDSHLLNPDYVKEHAAFLREQEKRNRPTAYIGVKQKDMRPSMRSVLVDWICEVCDQFKLSARTLFQAVDLIDRSLSAFDVPRGKLQLLGCACVVLASKYEEIYAPTAEELAHISDNTYTRGEIIAMELVVVNALQFRLSCITPCNFQDRFCRAAGSNARERSLVAYLMELLLQDYQGVTLLPSLKAAAALYLARQTLHPKGCPREAWTGQTEHYTGYCARDLEPCVRRLHSLHVRAEANNLHAVRDKYKKSAMHRVAEVTCALEDYLHFGD